MNAPTVPCAITDDRCSLCGGALLPWLAMPIDPIKDQPTPYASAMRCDACDTGSIRPLPSAAEIAGFYALDSYYTQGASHIPEVAPTLLDRVLIKLAWQVDRGRQFDVAAVRALLPDGGRVVDLGCGDGERVGELQAAGFAATGVEPDPAARARGAAAGLDIRPGTAEQPPAELAGADLVVMSHSLEHCREPGRAVASAAALLRPGGHLYCEVPNCAATHFRTFTICSTMFDAPRHLQFFTPAGLAILLERHGLAVVDRLFSGFTRVFQPGWRAWEATIHDRASRARPALRARRHDVAAAARLLAQTAFARPEAKYDSVGLLARKG